MKYKIKVTGDSSVLSDFVTYCNQHNLKDFKSKGYSLNSIKSIIKNADYSIGMRCVSLFNDSTAIVSGTTSSQSAGIDTEILLGMSKMFPKLYFEARSSCDKNMHVVGVEAYNGYISNPFEYESLKSLIEVYFTYMCSQKFYETKSANIKCSDGYMGSFDLVSEQVCCATDASVKQYDFNFDNGASFRVEVRVGADDKSKVGYNVFRIANKKDSKEKEFKTLADFFINNLSASFLNSHKANKINNIKSA
ncbi:hypothetical protein DC914_RS27250 [Vibrio parahaemolyticus]|uniref:hypothetical protein n=1 Tax=Vibrio parahaemolyticus TaxID=670 RepID=UPI0006A59A72|nr:hypothetical protein [Vibrio parahaemolyticus]KOF28279.1 hypothetical protein ACX13_16720 [Vibrio parahaemolyticus]